MGGRSGLAWQHIKLAKELGLGKLVKSKHNPSRMVLSLSDDERRTLLERYADLHREIVRARIWRQNERRAGRMPPPGAPPPPSNAEEKAAEWAAELAREGLRTYDEALATARAACGLRPDTRPPPNIDRRHMSAAWRRAYLDHLATHRRSEDGDLPEPGSGFEMRSVRGRP